MDHGSGLHGGCAGLVFLIAFFYFIATIPALFALVALRRRYRRMPQSWQWTIGVVAALLTILALAALGVQ